MLSQVQRDTPDHNARWILERYQIVANLVIRRNGLSLWRPSRITSFLAIAVMAVTVMNVAVAELAHCPWIDYFRAQHKEFFKLLSAH